MNLDLTGRYALVSGSTQGIGKAAAFSLAELGATVILLARQEQKLKAVSDELPCPQNQQHRYIVADFSYPRQVASAMHVLVGELDKPISILVNNTGGPAAGPAHEADIDHYRAAFEQHLVCNQLLVQAVVPGMREQQWGRIINVISTSVKAPLPNLGVSNTIRGAVANWAKTLANELGPDNITVNNVLPGATGTGRLERLIHVKAEKSGLSEDEVADKMKAAIPLGRFAKPEEVANAIAFLASPAAGYITGINVPVDGGRTPSL